MVDLRSMKGILVLEQYNKSMDDDFNFWWELRIAPNVDIEGENAKYQINDIIIST